MVNKIILIGNLGQDAELRYATNGSAVCGFSVATSEKWKSKTGDTQERTEWHRVSLWGKFAESLAQYLTKGKQVYIEGSLHTQKWQTKAGEDRTSVEIKAHTVRLIGGGGGSSGGAGRVQDQTHDNTPPEDDIPF